MVNGQPFRRFDMGRLVATPGALEAIPPAEVARAIGRHLRNDWGDCDRHDWRANDAALDDEARIFSVYHSEAGRTFWIITEADRSSTCVLLPEEY